MKKSERKNENGIGKNVWRKAAGGFTFVETLAVLSITAVLAAGTTVSATKLISMAKQISAKNQVEQFYIAAQSYFLDCGRFPTTEQGLMALWEKPVIYPIPENWNGHYLNKKPGSDPWGNEYVYIGKESVNFPKGLSKNLPCVILSYGADGLPGGKEKDVKSWE